ncbi:DUF411 domain-containing protein [Luteimonas sp. R10]|uniref:DUF411 domain-containing protein n=1 Tax=Luteimonas sp. R10 TaxID=3108176 RepID=UPI003086365D|nr:DUF411 domain-containing protein [Luteimonas sp. R10]
MSYNRIALIAILLASLSAITACAQATDAGGANAGTAAAGIAANALPPVVVHKSPVCGCCTHWVDHLRQSGFEVEVRGVDDLGPVKTRVGVPPGKGSCHTAEVAGYFVEGHVPAGDIRRLLAERPDARGLTLPGMPLGSPGMEVPDGTVQPYAVELVAHDGTTGVFARHGGEDAEATSP